LESLKLIVDKEIKAVEDDRFGHKDYSNALAEMIEHLKGSYSIGLLGPWGVGKSTIKELYCTGLKDDRKNEEILTITFNAWKYGGDDLKRALIMHVVKFLSNGDQTEVEEASDEVDSSTETIKEVPKTLKELSWDTVVMIFQFLQFSIPMILVMWLIAEITNRYTWLSGLMAIISAGVLGMLYRSWNNEDNKINFFNKKKIVKPPVTKSSRYEEILKKHLLKHLKKNDKYRKIVIFVDDLDRLSPGEMVKGLDAIRVFMEMTFTEEELRPDFEGFVFVVSCDEEKVAKALIPRTMVHEGEGDLPAAVTSIQDAKDFLDRIFQFRLEVAAVPKDNLRTFAHNLLEKEDNITSALEASGESLNNIVYRLIHSDVTNPRNAKQLINAFHQTLWMARRREERHPSELGSVLKGYLTGNLELIALFSAIRINYNTFHQHLLKEPRMLKSFMNMFVFSNDIEVSKTTVDELSESERNHFYQICTLTDDHKHYRLNKPYHNVRNYLSAHRDLDFPDNIRPFLLMNQEQIEKEIGDYQVVMNAIKASDVYTVLRLLQEPVEVQPLRINTINMLSTLIESTFIKSATEIEKAMASDVVAHLLPRLEVGGNHGRLTSFLAHNYSRNRICRDVTKVESLLQNIEVFDRGELMRIGNTIMSDFLNQEPNFRLKENESKSRKLSERFNFVLSKLFDIVQYVDDPDYTESFKTKLYDFIKRFSGYAPYRSLVVDGSMVVDQAQRLWGNDFYFDAIELLEGNISDKNLAFDGPISTKLLEIANKKNNEANELSGLMRITPIAYRNELKKLLKPLQLFIKFNKRVFSETQIQELSDICIEKIDEHYRPTDKESSPNEPMRNPEYISTLRELISFDKTGLSGFANFVVDREISKKEFVEDDIIDLISEVLSQCTDQFSSNIMMDWPNDIRNFKPSVNGAKRKCIFKNFGFLDETVQNQLATNLRTYPSNAANFNDIRRIEFARDWFTFVHAPLYHNEYVISVFNEYMSYLSVQKHNNYSNNLPAITRYIDVCIDLFSETETLLELGSIQSLFMPAISQLRQHLPSSYIKLFKAFKGKWKVEADGSGGYKTSTLIAESITGVKNTNKESDKLAIIESAFTIQGDDSIINQKRAELIELLLPMSNSQLIKVHAIITSLNSVPILNISTFTDILSRISYTDSTDKDKLLEVIGKLTGDYNSAGDIDFIQEVCSKLNPAFAGLIIDRVAFYDEALLGLLKDSSEYSINESIMNVILTRLIGDIEDDANKLENSDLLPVLPYSIKNAGLKGFKKYLTSVNDYLSSIIVNDDDISDEVREDVLKMIGSTNNSLVTGYLLDYMDQTVFERYEELDEFEKRISEFGDTAKTTYEQKFFEPGSEREDIY